MFGRLLPKGHIGGTILVGEGYKNLFKYNASQPLARNPEVVLDTAHRTDDWDDTGYDATPNLLLLDKGDPRGDVEFGFEEEVEHQTRHQRDDLARSHRCRSGKKGTDHRPVDRW